MKNKGFTLLELLLSLTILAVMISLVFSAFWTGIRSWEKSEAELPVSQRLRVVPRLIHSQVASLCLPKVLERDGEDFYFQGTAEEMEFFSIQPLSPEKQGQENIVYVKYRLTEKEDGSYGFGFYEKNIFDLDPEGLTDPGDRDFKELLADYRSISFSYLASGKNKQNNSGWQDSWKPDDNKEILPKAIRINFRESSREKAFSLIVPIRVEL